MPTVLSAGQRYRVLHRFRDPGHPDLEQAKRALELAKAEATIAQAIDDAPPLDPDTLARIRALIPAAPEDREAA